MKRIRILYLVFLLVIVASMIYVSLRYSSIESKEELINSLLSGIESIKVSTDAFTEGGYIPLRYTCEGADISPGLTWSNIPENTKSLLILVYDPDAPGGYFIHWIAYNIPPEINGLDEGASGELEELGLGLEAENDFGRVGYDGPCPPSGAEHRYYFVVLALDRYLDIPAGEDAFDILKSIKNNVLAYGILMGRYKR
jgi:hypothetical protein